MQLLTKVWAATFAVMIASTGFARDYNSLVAEGYRWVRINGPYACPTKEDLRDISRQRSEINKLHMVEELRAYFLIRGALVRVIKEDASTGMARVLPLGFLPIFRRTASFSAGIQLRTHLR